MSQKIEYFSITHYFNQAASLSFSVCLAQNFVLTRGSQEIKLIDFDGIGTGQRFFTREYQPYEHLQVGFGRILT